MGNIVVPQMFGDQLKFGHWSVDGLVFYWRGIPAGNVVDESPYGNHGTITGATWVGNGLLFDGDDDRVTIPISSSLNFSTGDLEFGFTIIAIVRPSIIEYSGIAGRGQFQDSGNGSYSIGIFTDGKFGVWVSDGTAGDRLDAVSDLELGVYSHVAATVDGISGTGFVYINGKQDATSTTWLNSTDFLQDVGDFIIGQANIISPGTSLNGSISDVKVYNRALSASEIAALYLNPNLPMQQPPIWLFTPPVVSAGMAGIYYRTLMQGVV